MYDAFISYNSADVAHARELFDRLVAAGISQDRIWFDIHRLRPGYDWHAEIEAACGKSHVVLPVLTPRWKESPWTRYETYPSDRVIPVVFEGPFLIKGDDGEVDWKASVGTPPMTRFQATAVDVDGGDGWPQVIGALREQLDRPALVRAQTRIDVPIGPNVWFVGREREMLAIHETLHRSPTAALTQGQVLAVSALGGIGKTTLVREYVEVFWRCYPQIFWVDCRKGVEAEFARIFQDLDAVRAGKLEPQERAAEAYRALRDGPARLLVLDNAKDERSVAGWVPRGGKCRTLITSRYANWSPSVAKLEVCEFKPEHSHEFLVRRTGRTAGGGERAACDELTEALGHLPLALEQAGAYMAHHSDYTFRSYLSFYQEARKDLLARGVLGTTDYPDSVATTWEMTVAELSSPARAVLRMASYFADTPIPLGLFRADTAIIRKLSELFGDAHAGPASTNDRAYVDAIAEELHGYSMARQRGDSLQVHNLVQVVERIRLDRATQAQSLKAAQDALAKYAPDETAESPRTWPVWDELLPHAEQLHATYVSNDCPGHRPDFEIMAALSSLYYGKGMHAMSLARAEDMLEVTRRVDGERSTNMANALLSYGESLRVLDRDEDAVDAFKQSLDIRERIDGEDHDRVADVLNYLALVIDTSSDEGKAEAEECFRKALKIYRSQGARVDRSDLVKCLNNFAQLLRSKREDAEALRLLWEAHELSDDPNDEKIKPQLAAIVRSVLASALSDQGDSRADSLYVEALNCLRDFPPDHPYCEQITHQYARFKRNRHELTEAKRIVSGIVPAEQTDDPIRLINHALRLKLRVCECVTHWPSALAEIDPVVLARFRALPEPIIDQNHTASDEENTKDAEGYTGIKVKGITLKDLENLSFDFVVNRGDLSRDDPGLPTTHELIEDFLTSMAVDEDQIWATEKECSPALRDTHLGRILTEQSSILKQAVTYLIHRAVEQSGTRDVLAPLFQGSSSDRRPVELEVWISPKRPTLYTGSLEDLGWADAHTDAPSAFVVEAEFGVHWEIRGLPADTDPGQVSSEIETSLVTTLTHWVNGAEPFTGLQRTNNPMVLAAWVKQDFAAHPALYRHVNSGKAHQFSPSVSAINPIRKSGGDGESENDESASTPLLPGEAVDLNQEAMKQRQRGRFDEAETLLRRAIEIEAETLSPSSPKHAHRRNNLALVLLLAGRLDESAEENALAWETKSSVCTGGHDMTSARILFVRLALDWLASEDASVHLGQLRTLLSRPELPALGGIQQTWEAEDILNRLTDRVAPEFAGFLRALVNAFNRRERVAELDAWRFWTEQQAVALETEW